MNLEEQNPDDYFSVSNESRWKSLRHIILCIDHMERPDFRSKCLTNGYVSGWDREWFYHFIGDGCKEIEWFELRGEVLLDPVILKKIIDVQFVGCRCGKTLRLYGYRKRGEIAEKIRLE